MSNYENRRAAGLRPHPAGKSIAHNYRLRNGAWSVKMRRSGGAAALFALIYILIQ